MTEGQTTEDKPEAFSVIIPCYNEESVIGETAAVLSAALGDEAAYECVFVNDGSTDGTAEKLADVERTYDRFRVVEHERNLGYGAALKTGIRQAKHELIAIIDADGTYPIADLPRLVELMRGHDMVVGARTGKNVTYSKLRALPKYFLKRWVSLIANRKVPDINSGMRVFRKDVAKEFFGILPDGFSFTITITLAMLTNKRPTLFTPIDYHSRVGQSKIKPIKDTLRFITIIGRTGVYFAPLRIFMPVVGILLACGVLSLLYDISIGNLTDKTVLIFVTAMNAAMFAALADMLDKRLK